MATGLENLKIYQMAKRLELEVHELLKTFPREEKFRTIDQLGRSSASVTNNIAESYYKKSVKEKTYILRNQEITEGEETRSNILRSAEKEFINSRKVEEISNGYIELRKATHGYIKFLQNFKTKTD